MVERRLRPPQFQQYQRVVDPGDAVRDAAGGAHRDVRDAAVRGRVLADRVQELAAMGLASEGPVDSSVAGARGNLEAFVLLRSAPGGGPE